MLLLAGVSYIARAMLGMSPRFIDECAYRCVPSGSPLSGHACLNHIVEAKPGISNLRRRGGGIDCRCWFSWSCASCACNRCGIHTDCARNHAEVVLQYGWAPVGHAAFNLAGYCEGLRYGMYFTRLVHHVQYTHRLLGEGCLGHVVDVTAQLPPPAPIMLDNVFRA